MTPVIKNVLPLASTPWRASHCSRRGCGTCIIFVCGCPPWHVNLWRSRFRDDQGILGAQMISQGELPHYARRRSPFSEPLEPRLLLAASIIKDINVVSEPSDPTGFVQAGNLLYFSANDGVTGHELWRTDGTEAGTVLVADLNPGPVSSRPNNLTNVNGRVFFTTRSTDINNSNP